MASVETDLDVWSQSLSHALKAIRRKRRLSATEVSRRMGMKRRSYSDFEAGRGPCTMERIMAFAHATECDPFAILLGVAVSAPTLAIRLTDNKLMTVFALLLREFDQVVGDDLERIDTSSAFSAFSTAFRVLANEAAVDRDKAAQAWLDEALAKLTRKNPPPKE
jgi:transcriptional regulator with XRE-family HTH domain